jgi:hypothetical protein
MFKSGQIGADDEEPEGRKIESTIEEAKLASARDAKKDDDFFDQASDEMSEEIDSSDD